jgi:hypothetical protein
MKAYLAGAGSMLLLLAAGFLLWTGLVRRDGSPIPAAPVAFAAPGNDVMALPDPPEATEKTREQKRFSRTDHDHDGKITRDEYLQLRRKNFAKLDTNGDGRLSFEEYAAKAIAKFDGADVDKSGALDPAEFATTRMVRKIKPRCPPAAGAAEKAGAGGEAEES